MVFTAEQAAAVSDRLAVLTEPTRLRVVQALDYTEEMCVGDVALALGVSEDVAGYALRVLRQTGLARPRRVGRVVFYRLAEGFPRRLLRDCIEALGRLSATEVKE